MVSPVAALRVVAAFEVDRAVCAAVAVVASGTAVVMSRLTLPANTFTVICWAVTVTPRALYQLTRPERIALVLAGV